MTSLKFKPFFPVQYSTLDDIWMIFFSSFPVFYYSALLTPGVTVTIPSHSECRFRISRFSKTFGTLCRRMQAGTAGPCGQLH